MDKVNVSKVLTIAGFDGSGGAGIQADLKTISALGCYATTALTAIPIQNTLGVQSICEIPTPCIEGQIRAILDDMQMDAVKIGMLYRKEIVEAVANLLTHYKTTNIVLDPVMAAKSGNRLLLPDAVDVLKEHLFPLTTILTPNLSEASELLGREISSKEQMEKAALELLEMGSQAVVVKGGHLDGACDDCLAMRNDSSTLHWFASPRIKSKNIHGTGCTFSAAIASFLARGAPILDSVRQAKAYLTKAIEAGAPLNLGRGQGAVHHFHNLLASK